MPAMPRNPPPASHAREVLGERAQRLGMAWKRRSTCTHEEPTRQDCEARYLLRDKHAYLGWGRGERWSCVHVSAVELNMAHENESAVHDTGRSTYAVARSVDVHPNMIWRTTEANRVANGGLRNFRCEGRSVRTCASRSVAGVHGALWSLGNVERLHMWCSRLREPFTRAPKQAEMGAGVGSPIEAVAMHDTARRRDLRKKLKTSNREVEGRRYSGEDVARGGP
ncbi:hypothetical protein HETIRDRAFT_430303 [Heterobasidion irregulare TC 32-1]|uniref:Uncharacterized protein n=1 Tax=Heterobasidion irregulare (strain TC 32-1) TaxID=747525 RepID=W4JQQ2_HETIT|nr:uncharacterized protein HETIRDRAFT_430303 [Heterobasidion irregulare TC 32-1]ETW75789.1 hypothetical protein HETIRDRAFT_430303 [Heterobasidion irregulare TC 32-1]